MGDVFNYSDYRSYLIDRFGQLGTRTGIRKKACEFLNCHSTYLSQVLSEKIHLSLEHAEALNEFFQHTNDEAEYFMLLVLKGRAGSQKLEGRFNSQLKEILYQRSLIKNRVKDAIEISAQEQDQFYSHWFYTALHVLVSIKELQTPEALSQATGIHVKKVLEAMEFLQKVGLILKSGNRFSIGPKTVHLKNDSHAITKHHINWRYHTIQNVSKMNTEDLHYSAAIVLSEDAAQEIKESLLKNLERHVNIIQKAPEETAYVYSFDFYKLIGTGM